MASNIIPHFTALCVLTNIYSLAVLRPEARCETVSSLPPSHFYRHSLPGSPSLANTDLFFTLIVLPFLKCHVNGRVRYIIFCFWLLP